MIGTPLYHTQCTLCQGDKYGTFGRSGSNLMRMRQRVIVVLRVQNASAIQVLRWAGLQRNGEIPF